MAGPPLPPLPTCHMNLKAETEKLGCFSVSETELQTWQKRNFHERFCYVNQTQTEFHFSFFNSRSVDSSLQLVWGESLSSVREILLTTCLIQPVLAHAWFSPWFWDYCHHQICRCWYVSQMSWPSNVVLSIFLVFVCLFSPAPAVQAPLVLGSSDPDQLVQSGLCVTIQNSMLTSWGKTHVYGTF